MVVPRLIDFDDNGIGGTPYRNRYSITERAPSCVAGLQNLFRGPP
jgi:hypothetical protein